MTNVPSRRLARIFGACAAAAVCAAEEPSLQKQIDELRRATQLLEQQVAGLTVDAGAGPPASPLRLLDLSLAVVAVGGGSSERDAGLAALQAGGHDPRQRGFSVPAVELAFSGAVDPFLVAEVRIATFISSEGETEVELEDAFARSRNLPAGLELKAGQYLTEFGRLNALHPHAWTWLDQPVINGRVFGADGMRGQGARIGLTLPLPWRTQALAGLQNAHGETMASFAGVEGDTVAGRPLGAHEVRDLGDLTANFAWTHALDLRDLALRAGVSAALGPNGAGADTRTAIYGAHVALRWGGGGHHHGHAHAHQAPGMTVTWETEVIARRYEVDDHTDDPDGVAASGDETLYPATTLRDRGLVSQLLVGVLPGWSAGLRYELATGSGESVGGRASDPTRDDRWRLSPLVVWQPSEASRLRLQYNLDRADHLAGERAHTVWLGVDVLLGSHAAHGF